MDVPGAVSVSFGEVKVVDTQAGPDLTTERRVRLVNKGGAAVAVDVAFDSRYPANPGVSYSLFLGGAALVNPVNVPANGAVEIIIRQNLDGARLAGLADPAIDKPVRLGGVSFRRNFLGESGGYLTITPRNNAPRLRVPVYAVHRAAGERGAVSPAFALGQSDKGTLTIPMRGPVMNPQLGRMVVRPSSCCIWTPGPRLSGSAAELAAVVTSITSAALTLPESDESVFRADEQSQLIPMRWSSGFISTSMGIYREWVLFNSSTRLFNGVQPTRSFQCSAPSRCPQCRNTIVRS